MKRGTWVKSSFSFSNSNCIELCVLAGRVLVRDTKNRGAGTLSFTFEEWGQFTSRVKQGA